MARTQSDETHSDSAEAPNSGGTASNQVIASRVRSLSSATLQCQTLERRIYSLDRAIQIVETALISLNAIEAILLDAESLLKKCCNVQSPLEKKALIVAYEEFCNQITLFADDASYEGQNLLNGDTITVLLDETGNTAIELVGEEMSARALGLVIEDGTEKLTYYAALERLEGARPVLRSQVSIFEARYNLLKNRIDLMEKLRRSFEKRARKLSAIGPTPRSLNVIVGTLRDSQGAGPATLEGTAVSEEFEPTAEAKSKPQEDTTADSTADSVGIEYNMPYPAQTDESATVHYVDIPETSEPTTTAADLVVHEKPETTKVDEDAPSSQRPEITEENRLAMESNIIEELEAALLDEPETSWQLDDEEGSGDELSFGEIDLHQDHQLEDISISRILKNLDDGDGTEEEDSLGDVPEVDPGTTLVSQIDDDLESEEVDQSALPEGLEQREPQTEDEDFTSSGIESLTESQESDTGPSKFGFGLVRKFLGRSYRSAKDTKDETDAVIKIPDILNSKAAEFAIIAMNAHCSHIAKFLMPVIYSDLLDQYTSGDSFVFPRAILSLEHSLVKRLLQEAWNTNSQIRLSTLGYYKEFANIIKISVEADPDAKSDILEFWAMSDYGKLYWLLYSAAPAVDVG